MTSAFRLAKDSDGLATLTFDAPGRKLNVFDRPVLEELEETLAGLAGDKDISCLVLLSGKDKSFIAGADISQIEAVTDPAEAEAGTLGGQRVFSAWQALPFPTVAAIQGVCLGGGLEIALASTYRVVSNRPDIRLGLPEVRLGIVPGWGGCTRLPQTIGLPDALDLILAGKLVRPKKALKLGLVDALLPEEGFLSYVREFAIEHRGQARRTKNRKGGFDLMEALLEKNRLGRRVVFDRARKTVLEKTGGHYPAPLRAIEVIRAGVEDGPEAGFAAEARANSELAVSSVAKSLIHVFNLTEEVKRRQGAPGAKARNVRHAAVIGAGTMGGGIAQLIADKLDVPVELKDIQQEALASGTAHAAELFNKKVKRRHLSAPEAERKMALIHAGLDYAGFSTVDFVIEAVVEKMPVKQAVFAELAKRCAKGAVLASNTSSLSVTEIGAKTPLKKRVAGMHFFNPVDRMPLVEVIASDKTDPATINTVFDLTRALGKTPVLVKDAPGFLVNRLLMFYCVEALWLLEERHYIESIDRAMKDWGMPMGPVALIDEVGIDVATHVAHILNDAFGDRLTLPDKLDAFSEEGRLGRKNGSGFYRYQGRERRDPDPEAYEILGLDPYVEDADPRALVDRMVLPMVNEAARCLEEGVVASPGELDLAMIMGTGFPPFRGGLCRWADTQGLGYVVASLEGFAAGVGERYAPSDALRAAAKAGGFYAWK